MRVHAVVLLLLVAFVSPVPAAVGGEPTDALLEPGHQLARRGDYADAEQFFADLAAQNSAVAPTAIIREAQAALADGDTSTAEADIQQLLDQYPNSDQLAPAYFTLEQIRRAAGDCGGALRALNAFVSTSGHPSLGPYVALQRAQCAANLGDWSSELIAAQDALATD